MQDFATPRSIVVGIDGSKAALRAAHWAVDEAVRRDVPLRLLYANIQDGARADVAGQLAIAESALRRAQSAIEETNRQVKIETEIVNQPPTKSLIRASASAAMVCVGAVGLQHFQAGRTGSTIAALAASAHCPVAIVRDRDDHYRQPAHDIVVEIDGAPDNGLVLGAAMAEALLRDAPIQAIVCRHVDDAAADGVGARRALADLDRRLARWKRQYPQLRVESVAVRGTLMEYLARRQRSVQLAIVGSHDRQHLGELVGPAGNAVLNGAACSLLIVNRQYL
ncbi:universal stress protein [Mycobacterium montefiorense]|uniref:Universal stress protein n=1 Tax=Mycobacterium montefiorense TaxID=154654 RepID=A0AA37PKH7_9MYCO|nr:universal stress protein [Mycobacterium montefiorense]GBG39179.1 universal stress protein [Mycobacterium montefiorense]GKU37348.1 universal stress protein [Mycobacterium montefiorense]GKU41996.1 universal stress protein [Mycobacterium montefiorense]GKU45542.1 universal stress protein [Mycobacterium montefiorense]GKU53496.1 universal stress protein [Mycobacterium montefiorense]